MTTEEHKLILAMFTQQARTIRALENLLKVHASFTDENLRGAQQAVDFEESQKPDLIPRTREAYISLAKRLGVVLPEPSP